LLSRHHPLPSLFREEVNKFCFGSRYPENALPLPLGYNLIARGSDQSAPPVFKNDVNGDKIQLGSLNPREDEIICAYEIVKDLDGYVALFLEKAKHRWEITDVLGMYGNI
jgi:hypothetical protein